MITILLFVPGCAPSTLLVNDFCYKYTPVYTIEGVDREELIYKINRNNYAFDTSCPNNATDEHEGSTPSSSTIELTGLTGDRLSAKIE
jgi:hypothetical protein